MHLFCLIPSFAGSVSHSRFRPTFIRSFVVLGSSASAASAASVAVPPSPSLLLLCFCWRMRIHVAAGGDCEQRTYTCLLRPVPCAETVCFRVLPFVSVLSSYYRPNGSNYFDCVPIRRFFPSTVLRPRLRFV